MGILNKNTFAIWLAFAFTGIGLLILLYFSFINKEFNDGSGIINTTIANDFGSFLGGVIGPIFSLSAFLLVYATLVEQQKTFELQKFEGRYFELLRYHRENVSLMRLRVPSQEDMISEGSSCFIEMKKQFDEIYSIIEKHATDRNITEPKKINISFLILYYGVGKATLPALLASVDKSMTDFAELIIKECKIKKAEYDPNIVYHGGNQSRLGHYFRNLSYIVNYVNEAKILTEQEKYEYVKMLRTQFSQYELAIFFFNSFTNHGSGWKKKDLINRYKLIKNIPENFLGEIDPKKYYNFKYEYEE